MRVVLDVDRYNALKEWCRQHGITFTALLESLGDAALSDGPNNSLEWLPPQIVESAQEKTAARRRRSV